MTRVRPMGFAAVSLLIAAAGCAEFDPHWNQHRDKPAVRPVADDGKQALAAHTQAQPEPGEVDPHAEPLDVADTQRRIDEFLTRLTQYDTPDDEDPWEQPNWAGATSEQPGGPYGPVVPRGGKPAANEGLDLTAVVDDGANESPTEHPPTQEKPRIERVVIRSSPPIGDATDQESKTMGINTALETIGEQAHDGVEATIEQLKEHVADNPNDPDALWRLILLLLATGQEFEASELLGEISSETGETIASTADLIRRVRQALSEPGPATDRALEAINDLRHHFSRDAELLIPKVALCTKVSTFGVYDEMNASVLVPHHANPAIVYCEIKNFFCEHTPNDTFRVTLSSRLEILTADGKSMWTHKEPDIEDVSKQRREDFFLAQLVTFPANMAPGDYVLKVSIEDTTAAKAAEAVYPFRVGAAALSSAAR